MTNDIRRPRIAKVTVTLLYLVLVVGAGGQVSDRPVGYMSR